MYEAIVSIEDKELSEKSWRVLISKNSTTQYAVTGGARGIKTQYMHRVIMERILGRKLKRSEHIDHINGNGLDNRRENLRVATALQNAKNKRLSQYKPLRYKGVTKTGRNSYSAKITVNYEYIYLGRFDTAKEAHEAYCEASKKYHGEFGNTGE